MSTCLLLSCALQNNYSLIWTIKLKIEVKARQVIRLQERRFEKVLIYFISSDAKKEYENNKTFPFF